MSETFYILIAIILVIVISVFAPKIIAFVSDGKTNKMLAGLLNLISDSFENDSIDTKDIEVIADQLSPYLDVIVNADGPLYDENDLFERTSYLLSALIVRVSEKAPASVVTDIVRSAQSQKVIQSVLKTVLKQVTVVNPKFGAICGALTRLLDVISNLHTSNGGGKIDEPTT